MKHTKYLYPLLLLMLIACFEPQINDETPNWVLDRIALAESGQDSMQIDSIIRYDCHDQFVYYFKNYLASSPHILYDYDGSLLGCYNDAWLYLSDSLFVDFQSTKSNDSLIWQNPLEANLDSTQDYDIINALLADLYGNETFLHVYVPSDNQVDTENLAMNLAGWDNYVYHKLALSALDIKNTASCNIDSSKLTLPSIHMFTKAERDDVFCAGSYPNAWNNYYCLYPDSKRFITLGLPALNPEGTRAFIEISDYRNYWSARGYLYILEKQGADWVVIHLELTWRT